MKLGMKQLGGIVSAAALTVAGLGLLGSSGCGDDLKDAACGDFECEKQGFAQGNASITGVKSVDGFFQAALNFTGTADVVAGGIKAEIDGLRADLELDANADIGAALKAKFETDLKASIKVEAQPARCEVDARAELSASLECQAEAKCEVEVDPGKVELACKGSCEVEASANVSCGAEVEASCTFRGPEVACTGECKGTCTVDASLDVECGGTCEGTCNGECDGECTVKNGDGSCAGECRGTCGGKCEGTCKINSEVGASCKGTCSGECVARGPELDCTGAVEAKCEGSADAMVMCSGECKGDFEPPSATASCEARANCDAQAKANASLKVECTPPSIAVKAKLDGSLSGEAAVEAQAKLDYAVAVLKLRLPRILASLEKAKLVLRAGGELTAAAEGAVDGALEAVASGDVSASAKIKLLQCAPKEFKAAAQAMKSSTADLTAQVNAAASIQTSLLGG